MQLLHLRCCRQDMLQGQWGAHAPLGALHEHVVEHVFELSVVAIKGLRLQENMIWGEADCFVQYHFPAQSKLKQQGAPDIVHGEWVLTSLPGAVQAQAAGSAGHRTW